MQYSNTLNRREKRSQQGTPKRLRVPEGTVADLHKKGVNPNLVAVDHEFGRAFSDALPDKSVLTVNGWIRRRLARDIGNLGCKDVKIAIKSDQERHRRLS